MCRVYHPKTFLNMVYPHSCLIAECRFYGIHMQCLMATTMGTMMPPGPALERMLHTERMWKGKGGAGNTIIPPFADKSDGSYLSN